MLLLLRLRLSVVITALQAKVARITEERARYVDFVLGCGWGDCSMGHFERKALRLEQVVRMTSTSVHLPFFQ